MDSNRELYNGVGWGLLGLAAGMVGFSAGVTAGQETPLSAAGMSPTVNPITQTVTVTPKATNSPTSRPETKQSAVRVNKHKTAPPDFLLDDPVGGEGWLQRRLLEEGLSPDEARGALAMNRVEGGTLSHLSILGFTEAQTVSLLGFGGPEGHLQAFLRLQWRDMSRRAGGHIPGIEADGTVTDVEAYLHWIRVKIVGQIGYASDWEGNRQPHPDLYQRHLREAWDGGTPAFGWGMPGGPENQ